VSRVKGATQKRQRIPKNVPRALRPTGSGERCGILLGKGGLTWQTGPAGPDPS
jgi:hypothetical protein